MQWDLITKKANANVELFTQVQRYISLPSIEPENPVYTKKIYGANTVWKHLNDEKIEVYIH